MRRGWELLALLVIGGLLLQAAVAFLRPLVPYIVVPALLLVVTAAAVALYRNHRSW